MVCLLAGRYATKSNVKLGGFRSQLQESYVGSPTADLWYNETVCLWMTIYIYIYIYIYMEGVNYLCIIIISLLQTHIYYVLYTHKRTFVKKNNWYLHKNKNGVSKNRQCSSIKIILDETVHRFHVDNYDKIALNTSTNIFYENNNHFIAYVID